MTSLENSIDHSIEHEALELNTTVYLDEGFIDEEDLNEDGLYTDEYSDRSESLLVKMGNKEATIRLIHADKKGGGILSLPTTQHFSIDPAILCKVAGVTRLSDLAPEKIVELSGLAAIKVSEETTRAEAFDATRQIYASSLRRSLDQGHKAWVMNVDERLTKFLDLRLGTDSYSRLGEEQTYMGPPTVPVAMSPQKVVESVLKGETGHFSEENMADLRNVMQGVSETFLPRKLIKLLHDNDIETQPNSVASKLWHNKKAAFYGSMIGYSALRFLPVGVVEEFDGSVLAFGAIDVVTAGTQVASMELFFRGKNRAVRAIGVLGTGASFAAPYAYFYANGSEYPWYVNVVAGGFVAIGTGLEVDRSVRDAKLKAGLEATDLEPTDEEQAQ